MTSVEGHGEVQAAAGEQPALIVKIGHIDISEAQRSVRTKIGSLGAAEVVITEKFPLLSVLDWRPEIRIEASLNEEPYRLFTGHVVEASLRDGDIWIECANGMPLKENRVMRFVSNCTPFDVIYALTRTVGISEEVIQLQGYVVPDDEVFDVIVPLRNIQLEDPIAIGNVTLLRRGDIAWALSDDEEDLTSEEFNSAESYALFSTPPMTRMFDAESRGLAEFEQLLAYLHVRARFSSAQLPSGVVPRWMRDTALSDVRLIDLVLVKGRSTGRSWIRDPRAGRIEGKLNPADESLSILQPSLSGQLDQRITQALISCDRAIWERNPIVRVNALWEAIEYYAGRAEVPQLFTKEELRMIKQSIRTAKKEIKDNPSQEKAQRLDTFLGQLNNPPIFTKLKHQLRIDAIPVSELDLLELRETRPVRNNSMHGSVAKIPTMENIDRAIAVVVRILIYWISRQG